MSAASAPLAAAAREALRSSYEDLRRRALAPGASSRGAGFALFVHWGMGSWMETCADLPAPPPRVPTPARVGPAPNLPDGLRFEVAVVLAQMALSAAHGQGATT